LHGRVATAQEDMRQCCESAGPGPGVAPGARSGSDRRTHELFRAPTHAGGRGGGESAFRCSVTGAFGLPEPSAGEVSR